MSTSYLQLHKLATNCSFSVGQVVGGSEKKVGVTNTSEECVTLVMKTEPTARGVLWGDPSLMDSDMVVQGYCYAEFGDEISSTDYYAEYWIACLFKGTVYPYR